MGGRFLRLFLLRQHTDRQTNYSTSKGRGAWREIYLSSAEYALTVPYAHFDPVERTGQFTPK